MRTLKRTMVVAALGTAAIGTVGVGSASAATAPAGHARPATVYNVPCWTTFVPDNPNGGPMTQYYANCSGVSAIVCPEEVEANGTTIVFTDVAAYVGPYDGIADDSDTAVWGYAATDVGAHYTTVFC